MPVVEHRHIVKLLCTSENAAENVVKTLATEDDFHWVREGGHNAVAIGYLDPGFPMDVADWAEQHGYAEDSEVDATKRSAQKNMGLL